MCYDCQRMRTIRLSTESYSERAALDTAVSRALMMRVAEGREPESLRVFRPGAIVAFGAQDQRAPGYVRAVAAAQRCGFAAVNRMVGGTAAVFHERTIAFTWTVPDNDPRQHIEARFRETANIVAAALRRLGVDARVGEVPGEYCPGAHSVNAGGRAKLMGVGQRIVSGAAHVGGVVVVGDSDRIREVLTPVYDALGHVWRPETASSVEDELGPTRYADVRQAIVDEFAARYELREAALPTEVAERALTLEAEHAVETIHEEHEGH